MKKLFTLFFALVASITFASATIFEKVLIDGLYYDLDDATLTAMVVRKSDMYQSFTSVIIPDTVDYNEQKFSVKAIGDDAFYDCSSLQTVQMPDGLTHIGVWAFKGCSALKNICLPDSVYIVGESAFENCSSLEGICFWCNGKSMQIGNNAFKGCSGIKYLSFPGKFDSLGTDCFNFGNSGTVIKVYCYEDKMKFPSGSYYSLSEADAITAFSTRADA